MVLKTRSLILIFTVILLGAAGGVTMGAGFKQADTAQEDLCPAVITRAQQQQQQRLDQNPREAGLLRLVAFDYFSCLLASEASLATTDIPAAARPNADEGISSKVFLTQLTNSAMIPNSLLGLIKNLVSPDSFVQFRQTENPRLEKDVILQVSQDRLSSQKMKKLFTNIRQGDLSVTLGFQGIKTDVFPDDQEFSFSTSAPDELSDDSGRSGYSLPEDKVASLIRYDLRGIAGFLRPTSFLLVIDKTIELKLSLDTKERGDLIEHDSTMTTQTLNILGVKGLRMYILTGSTKNISGGNIFSSFRSVSLTKEMVAPLPETGQEPTIRLSGNSVLDFSAFIAENKIRHVLDRKALINGVIASTLESLIDQSYSNAYQFVSDELTEQNIGHPSVADRLRVEIGELSENERNELIKESVNPQEIRLNTNDPRYLPKLVFQTTALLFGNARRYKRVLALLIGKSKSHLGNSTLSRSRLNQNQKQYHQQITDFATLLWVKRILALPDHIWKNSTVSTVLTVNE